MATRKDTTYQLSSDISSSEDKIIISIGSQASSSSKIDQNAITPEYAKDLNAIHFQIPRPLSKCNDTLQHFLESGDSFIGIGLVHQQRVRLNQLMYHKLHQKLRLWPPP